MNSSQKLAIIASLGFGVLFTFISLQGCSGPSEFLHKPVIQLVQDNDQGTPLKLVGERLFRDTRFSQYFYAHVNGRYNHAPRKGDPVVESMRTLKGTIPSPDRGQAISCASCHLVEQADNTPGGGSRAYTDFFRVSPIPDRGDGQYFTARNAPIMVGSSLKSKYLLHWDGNFGSPEDLVRGTYLGRNLGWLPGEENLAIKNMAAVIRADNGKYPTDNTDNEGGLSYRDLMGADAKVPPQFRIPKQYRINVTAATDVQIFNAVVKLEGGYLRSLDFHRDSSGHYDGSPFDYFLHKNNLPLGPADNETPYAYTIRLAKDMARLKHPQFVSNRDRRFHLIHQAFVFGPSEMRGFLDFAGSGRCVECHEAPDFTDHLFHNIGASQLAYDAIHGQGSFMNLPIPNLAERESHPGLYLPQSDHLPNSISVFRSAPSKQNAMMADLGAWNIFANPDMPSVQSRLRHDICQGLQMDCSQMTDAQVLKFSIAMVKTPTLRDLGQSAPYLHTGQLDTIRQVIAFLMEYSELARQNQVRNADPRLKDIRIQPTQVNDLVHFLKSLNEDYD